MENGKNLNLNNEELDLTKVSGGTVVIKSGDRDQKTNSDLYDVYIGGEKVKGNMAGLTSTINFANNLAFGSGMQDQSVKLALNNDHVFPKTRL